MGNEIDLMGRRFGKWTILARAARPPNYKTGAFWLCRCDCGVEAVRKGAQLLHAERKGVKQSCQSCGATDAQTTHGLSKTRIYKVWHSMLERCNNPAHQAYPLYGGRGITVCDRWSVFDAFFADMGHSPPGMSLDRINNDKGYSPENCRWASYTEQNRNRMSNHMLTFNGKTQTVSAWAEELGIDRSVIYVRINSLGWSVEEALGTPVGEPKNWRGKSHKDATQYELNGKSQSLSDWAKELGVNNATLYSRIKRGWPLARALSA